MSIKTALLAMALGVASAGLAQANPVAAPDHAPTAPLGTPATHMAPPHAAATTVPPHASMPAPAVQHAPPASHGKTAPHHTKAHKPFHVGQHLTRAQVSHATHMDWQRAGLHAPKKGEQWLHVNGQHVLIKQSNHRVLRVS